MSFLTGKERREAMAEAEREEERVEQSAALYWKGRAERAEGVLRECEHHMQRYSTNSASGAGDILMAKIREVLK